MIKDSRHINSMPFLTGSLSMCLRLCLRFQNPNMNEGQQCKQYIYPKKAIDMHK